MSMIWSSRERNRSCSPLSRRSRGRIANPPLHHLEQKNHSLRFVRILKTEFARNSPSRGPNLANSITWPRTISPSVQWLENSSRTTTYPTELDGKAGAAAAGGGGLRVVHPERGADQVVDEVDLGPRHVVERHRVDQHGRPVLRDDDVVVGLGAVDVELVLEARAAAAFDADAQHGAGAFALEDFADALRCPRADRDVHVHDVPRSNALAWTGCLPDS